MTSRVIPYCDFCGSEIDLPSQESPVVLIGFRSYSFGNGTHGDYHRADVCTDCLGSRDIASELFKMEREDREKNGMLV